MTGFTVKVYRKYYLESEVYEGDNNGPSTRVYEDEYTNMHAVDVVRLCTEYGLTFEGADWAHQIDGSSTVNYSTGEEMEVTLHLEGCPERVENAIREAVK